MTSNFARHRKIVFLQEMYGLYLGDLKHRNDAIKMISFVRDLKGVFLNAKKVAGVPGVPVSLCAANLHS